MARPPATASTAALIAIVSIFLSFIASLLCQVYVPKDNPSVAQEARCAPRKETGPRERIRPVSVPGCLRRQHLQLAGIQSLLIAADRGKLQHGHRQTVG